MSREVSLGKLEFGMLQSLVVSPDSRRVAYGAKRGGKRLVVVEGVQGKEYDGIGPLVCSPDSRRVAYGAKQRRVSLSRDSAAFASNSRLFVSRQQCATNGQSAIWGGASTRIRVPQATPVKLARV